MKKDSRIKLNKAVDILHHLHFKSEDIMVTGSIALDLLGLLPENRTAHDVDFIIRMSEDTWRCLTLLEALGKDNCQNYPDKDRCLVFKGDGIVINIWKGKGKEITNIKDSQTGVYIAPAYSIFSAKKLYGRDKDYKDISDICKSIL